MNLTQVEREARKERKMRNGTKRKRAARWPAYTQAHSWSLTGERPKLPTQKAGGAAAWLRRAGPNSRQPTGSPLKTLGRRHSPHSRLKASPGDWGHFMKERLLINQMNYNLEFSNHWQAQGCTETGRVLWSPRGRGRQPEQRGSVCSVLRRLPVFSFSLHHLPHPILCNSYFTKKTKKLPRFKFYNRHRVCRLE